MGERSWVTLGLVAMATIGGGALVGCSGRGSTEPEKPGGGIAGGALDRTLPPPDDDGQWTMPAKDYENRRFSGLHEIDSANVAGLKVAWTFSTGIPRGHEGAPL